MELRQLRYFVAVAEAAHMTRAAEQLGIQQPPLSQQIRLLEQQLGVRLFHRHPKGMSLTDPGKILLEEARRILQEVASARQLMARVAQGRYGRLAIGFTSSAAAHAFTPEVLREYRARHAEVELEISEMNAADLTDAVAAARVHVGLLRVPVARPPGIAFETLLSEPVRVALPLAHPLALREGTARARARPVALKQLADDPFILVRRPGAPGLYANLLALCEAQGFVPRIAAEVDRMMTSLNLVAAGVGVTVVPASMQGAHAQAVVYRPLAEGGRLDAPLTLVYREDDCEGPAAHFTSLARRLAKRTQPRTRAGA
ncbi:LysR family transcriptional regulator [Aquabacterium sp.]|uniref:LysR family transcriptional regulator n=1 Tax=Aquabacterium sp. TaxID=1872578 RepID=UPI0037846879